MNETILRLKEKKDGTMNKVTFFDLPSMARECKTMPTFKGMNVKEIQKGVLSAIEKGHDFPKDSGYTWDILLTSANMEI